MQKGYLMNTSYGLDAYRAHDLNIAMRTSSGDVIKMDFANHSSTSISHEEGESGSKTAMSFSSMQSFEFSIEGNGIDAQDQKEIDEFMKIAQPFIDDFLKELKQDAPKTPVTKLAHEIAAIFDPNRDRSENSQKHVKNNIVKTFDNAMKELEIPKSTDMDKIMDKMFKDAQKLLEKTLKEFDNFNKEIYG